MAHYRDIPAIDRSIGVVQQRLNWLANTLRHRLLTATPMRRGRAVANRRRVTRFAAHRVDPVFAPLVDDGVQAIRTGGLSRIGVDEAVVSALAATVPNDPAWRDGPQSLESDAVAAAYPSAYRLGLAADVLDFAEAYLQQPCFYLGATIKREVADGVPVGARQWHLDVEDDRMLRILIYLSPVAAGSGPFEYVVAPRSAAARAASGYLSGYLRESRMRALVPADEWDVALGSAGDAVLFDGTRVFHRAQPPRDHDRYSITLAFVSRRPLQLRLTSRLSHRCREAVMRGLPPRIAACIPPARA